MDSAARASPVRLRLPLLHSLPVAAVVEAEEAEEEAVAAHHRLGLAD